MLNRRDAFHAWAVDAVTALPTPLLTCDAVVTECCYLLRRLPDAVTGILTLLQRGVIRSSFRLESEALAVSVLMKRYADQPMSLADASLVRLAELCPNPVIVTLDGDFRMYRRHGRQTIPLIAPKR